MATDSMSEELNSTNAEETTSHNGDTPSENQISEAPATETPTTEAPATQTTASEQPAADASGPEASPEMGSGAGDEVVTPAQATLQEGTPAGKREPREKKEGNRDKKRRPNDRKRDGQPGGGRGDHSDARRKQNAERARQQRAIKKFVVVTWSSQREPADNMFWAEAERQGDWVIVNAVEQVRTRREILERLQEMKEGLVALEFNFGYPEPFMEFLKPSTGVDTPRALWKKVREDLKKNSDDGVRHWIERMGQYRESHLEPEEAQRERPQYGRGPRDRDRRGNRPMEPYERRSTAERFRRTDLTLRRAADQHLVSPLQIGYNRLVSRYEFNDPALRGRGALLGMSMLDQLIEGRDDIAVWPFQQPKALTLVEIQPWIYTKGKTLPAEEIRRMMSNYEDAGWDIPSAARDLAARNNDAQRAILTLIGMIKTETRVERAQRPLRDYPANFYEDTRIQHEGWFYGVGYRSPEAEKKDGERSKSGKGDRNKNGRSKDDRAKTGGAKEDRPKGERAPREQGGQRDARRDSNAAKEQTSDSTTEIADPTVNSIVNESNAGENASLAESPVPPATIEASTPPEDTSTE